MAKELLPENVLSILSSRNMGVENATKQKMLSAELGVSTEQIRGAINYLRSMGFPICSGRQGVWYAKNKVEIKDTIDNLQHRINGIANAMRGLEEAYESN